MHVCLCLHSLLDSRVCEVLLNALSQLDVTGGFLESKVTVHELDLEWLIWPMPGPGSLGTK